MEVHQLRYFCAIARHGTFTRAAKSEHVAQPSLSQQILKLEDELGGKLFDRLPRAARLTTLGQFFLPHALAILQQICDSKAEARKILAARHLRVEGKATLPAANGSSAGVERTSSPRDENGFNAFRKSA
jgi:LysR family hydrogen peroxide-inducible transcriptional activator